MKWPGPGKLPQVGWKGFLKEPPKTEGCFEHAICCGQWEDAVGVHRLHANRNLTACRSNHPWEKKPGESIRNHQAGPLRKRMEQSLSSIFFRFHIGIVKNGGFFKCTCILSHTLHDKTMKAITGPGIPGSQGFQHHKGLVEFPGPFNGAVKTEIPAGTAKCNHPVKDIIPVDAYSGVVCLLDPHFGDSVHTQSATYGR